VKPEPETTPRTAVLITGFGPFPGVPDNLSGPFALSVAAAARRRFPHLAITADILDTVWTTAPERVSHRVNQLKPRVILHFGVSRAAYGVVIETRGHRACDTRRDALGHLPPLGLLPEAGHSILDADFPIDAADDALTAQGIDVSFSNDAGRYLCNAVLYQAIFAAQTLPHRCMAGFIHLPVAFGPPGLTQPQALTAGLTILETCLAAVGEGH
jgi:pyroglutamyl-peptidase